ncbi:Recombinase family protein [Deinococcus saxicola]|uniref:recombinase family protein n=1 Tax=Deinococcus saxicola TaxID=249406 RepID=UPI0039EF5F38
MTVLTEGKFLSHQKIQASHLEGLAIVYVRQSTLGQLQRHQESTRLQYALADYAQSLGWARDRVLVIDDDLGKSGSTAVGRTGFHRLVTEVSLGHVGLILGIEMSRLARSNRDWHHLLEVCALFRTLIADTDGLYNPTDYNDRLLLGLKGTMSEAELHILKNRLNEGKLSKARRGELAVCLPVGYVRAADHQIQFDPDEQVQQVVSLIFRKFDELGTIHAVLQYLVRHGINLGIRCQSRADARLEWRRPNRMTLQNMLRNPIYAGVYAYGRRQTDARKQRPGRPATGRVIMPTSAWHVLLRDQVPAYIHWETYQAHLVRLAANRNVAGQTGIARNGAGLLAGLLVCGSCSRRLSVRYQAALFTYTCTRNASDYGGRSCLHCAGKTVDAWVVSQLLLALRPASLALSLQTMQHLETERAELNTHWKHRLERAAYEVSRAARQYQAVEPEHRLVARSLERAWEQALEVQRDLQEEYERVQHHTPRTLSKEEVEQIQALAEDLPALWAAETTTIAERKEILRLVIKRVIVHSEQANEQITLEIHWCGGQITSGTVFRPVARVKQLSYYDDLVGAVKHGVAAGKSAQQVAEELNTLGFRPAKRSLLWQADTVRSFARDLGLPFARGQVDRPFDQGKIDPGEAWWTLQELAVTLGMPSVTLYHWLRRGQVKSRRNETGRRWLIWADEQELSRLRTKLSKTPGEHAHDRWIQQAAHVSQAVIMEETHV